MATNTLLNYLRAVLKLETECRTLSISMKRNRQQAASLAANPGIDTTETKYFRESEVVNSASFFLLVLSIILFVVYWRLCGADVVFDLMHDDLTTLDKFSFILLGPPIICLIGFFKCISGTQHLYDEGMKKYQQDVTHNKNLSIKIDRALSILDQDYQTLKQHYDKVYSTLQQYYDLDILYPKYRGLVPVSMFVQYFASRRVSKLEGHTGAYNLYEQERLQHVIISKLDIVISRLDEIQSTQYELAQALQQSNQKITALSNQADIMNQHMEVQAYNSMQTNEEVKALKDYTIFRDLLR